MVVLGQAPPGSVSPARHDLPTSVVAAVLRPSPLKPTDLSRVAQTVVILCQTLSRDFRPASGIDSILRATPCGAAFQTHVTRVSGSDALAHGIQSEKHCKTFLRPQKTRGDLTGGRSFVKGAGSPTLAHAVATAPSS